MATLRIGLIGAGANTRLRHIPGFQTIEGVEIVSVCNRSRESGDRVAREFGIARVAESVTALIADPRIDAVCIGTWPDQHREYTVAALAAGKHVLCEARMARDGAEAEAMLAAAEARPDLIAQLVPAPFDLRLGSTITRMVRDGVLGEIHEATVTHLTGAGLDPAAPLHWRHRVDLSGHNTMTLGILNETLRRWLGDTSRVLADARIFVRSRPAAGTGAPVQIEIPDSLTVAAEMAIGARATYHLSTMADGAPANGIVLYGSKATLRWSLDGEAVWAPHGEPFRSLAPDPGSDRGWRVETDFIDSIRRGTPVTLTAFRDGVRYMRFTDAVWRSWHEGVAVPIAPL